MCQKLDSFRFKMQLQIDWVNTKKTETRRRKVFLILTLARRRKVWSNTHEQGRYPTATSFKKTPAAHVHCALLTVINHSVNWL